MKYLPLPTEPRDPRSDLDLITDHQILLFQPITEVPYKLKLLLIN